MTSLPMLQKDQEGIEFFEHAYLQQEAILLALFAT